MTKAQEKTVEEPTSLAVIESVNAVELFASDESLQKLLDQIKKEALSIVPDLSTADSRKFVATNAYNVRRCKTVIDKGRLLLVKDEKARLKIIDARGAHAKAFLDKVAERARKELTDWEAKQEAIAQAQADQDALNAAEEEAYHLNDLWDREATLKAAEDKLKAEQVEQDRIELEHQAEQDRKDREEQIRKDTEEATKKANEDAIQAEKGRADQAERDRIAAEEKAAQEKLDAEEKAEQDKLDAVDQERIRVATKAAKDQAEEDRLAEIECKRAANVEHRREINNEIVAAFVEHEYHETMAQHIVTLIAQGKIPHMEIKY